MDSLPDPLLSGIISFLETQEGVKMSVLSKRWRFQYLYTSRLSFRRSIAPTPDLIHVVDRMVRVHRVNIKEFTLWLGFFHHHVDASLVKAWVEAVVNRGLERLVIKLEGVTRQDDYDWAPDLLFVSETLFVIDLEAGPFLRTPDSVWLPSLKILHLRQIQFLDPGSMTRLIHGCELLEELSLDRCWWGDGPEEYCIHAPKLIRLKIDTRLEHICYARWRPRLEFNLERLDLFEYRGSVQELYWINTTSLAQAKIVLMMEPQFDFIVSLLRSISNATKLQILDETIQAPLVLRMEPSSYALPSFDNLEQLEVGFGAAFMPRGRVLGWKILQLLLYNSPKLETIIFRDGFEECYDNLIRASPTSTLPLPPSLKLIEVNGSSGTTVDELAMRMWIEENKCNSELRVKFLMGFSIPYDDLDL